jgi:glycosyltransferase involved in cell wall biosynthesis
LKKYQKNVKGSRLIIRIAKKTHTIKFLIAFYFFLKSRFAPVTHKKVFSLAEPAEANDPIVFIDLTVLSRIDAGGGIQRVQKMIGRQAFRNKIYNARVIYYDGENYRCYEREDLQTSDKDSYVTFARGDIYLTLDLNYRFVLENAKEYKKLNHQGVQIWFVVYDLLPIYFPNFFIEGISELHMEWFNIISKFSGIVAISHTTAVDCKSLLSPGHSLIIKSFKLGFDFHSLESKLDGHVKDSNPLNGLSFLMVGTVEPRKGYDQILRVFDQLWTSGSQNRLTIVGKSGWKSSNLIQHILDHKEFGRLLKWEDDLGDDDLFALYQRSDYLIAASYAEGFGLPIVEAMQFGLKIIARDIPIFREVAASYPIYFSGDSDSEIKNLLIKLGRDDVKKADTDKLPRTHTWEESFVSLMESINAPRNLSENWENEQHGQI